MHYRATQQITGVTMGMTQRLVKRLKKKSTFVIYGLPSHRHFWMGGDGMKSKSQSRRHKRAQKTKSR